MDVMSSCKAASARVRFSGSCDEEMKYPRAMNNHDSQVSEMVVNSNLRHQPKLRRIVL
jgi:hypothetical protein